MKRWLILFAFPYAISWSSSTPHAAVLKMEGKVIYDCRHYREKWALELCNGSAEAFMTVAERAYWQGQIDGINADEDARLKKLR